MAVPGTGSTNQSMTLSAFKKLAGRANTSALREVYEESIPSNIQLNTSTVFGQAIPQTVSTDNLYDRFSASASDPVTAEYVEFYLESISGTTYDADTGSFGQVGFGAGDESQSAGPHAYQLRLTSSYQTLSSNASKGSGFFVNNQTIHEANGGIQLVPPSLGPQTGNKYGLSLYTAHPVSGGVQIQATDAIDWQIDYFNGIVFIQDYRADKIPTYARGFIYIGKYADTLITEASSSGGGGGSGDVSYGRTAVATHTTASTSDKILGVNATASLEIRLPAASGFSAGQYFTVKDEAGNANTNNITILTTGADTIDGRTFVILESSYAAINLYSNGSNKFFIY